MVILTYVVLLITLWCNEIVSVIRRARQNGPAQTIWPEKSPVFQCRYFVSFSFKFSSGRGGLESGPRFRQWEVISTRQENS
ncbi:hypothetical protein RHMOL_Rhmol09G0139200 [Rhododendron molle]|uniref:Uncharacterized protein n=1 Tax=Rhododendron molle TaxID=49168 RepID=A0ACC0MEA1_RHOML|nr:hypothetical protein RHMOL_Rhmol09G0139200 [Rhododendron molle]